jgi:hypothetical protein
MDGRTLPIGFYRRYVKPWLGTSLSRFVSNVFQQMVYLRLSPGVTKIAGLEFPRSRDLAEIDITYLCNLNCFNCNRSCEQQPTTEHMSLGQIRYFLEESRARGHKWKRLRIVGGEPTVHPRFMEVLDLILDYRKRYFPDMKIELTTNGYGAYVNRMIEKIPAEVDVTNNAKVSQVQSYFQSFNVAPIDVPDYNNTEFANGCPITKECGVGVTPYGYYPCTVAGAIDRTFGFDMGRKRLPDDSDGMEKELRKFCSLCGHFKRKGELPVEGPVQSPVWREAYGKALKQPPVLSLLPELNEDAKKATTKAATTS